MTRRRSGWSTDFETRALELAAWFLDSRRSRGAAAFVKRVHQSKVRVRLVEPGAEHDGDQPDISHTWPASRAGAGNGRLAH